IRHRLADPANGLKRLRRRAPLFSHPWHPDSGSQLTGPARLPPSTIPPASATTAATARLFSCFFS
ncbi:MAG: hypothetical protein V4641_30195, partial [Pseudomonadota bacterium]